MHSLPPHASLVGDIRGAAVSVGVGHSGGVDWPALGPPSRHERLLVPERLKLGQSGPVGPQLLLQAVWQVGQRVGALVDRIHQSEARTQLRPVLRPGRPHGQPHRLPRQVESPSQVFGDCHLEGEPGAALRFGQGRQPPFSHEGQQQPPLQVLLDHGEEGARLAEAVQSRRRGACQGGDGDEKRSRRGGRDWRLAVGGPGNGITPRRAGQ
eukprot:scaffold16092_cov127-Isochrysis_galbana.AAC.19